MTAARKENQEQGAVGIADPWVSVPAAARLLGCANATVLAKALRGEIEAQVVAGRTVISRASIDRALAAAAA